MYNPKQHIRILEIMQMTNQPMRSRDINDIYANLYGKHMMSTSGRLSDLSISWYIDVIHIPKKEDRKNAWYWYILTDIWKVPWVVPIMNHVREKSKLRSSTEESIIKKENKELNIKFVPAPPIIINWFVRLKNFLFFNKNK